MDLSAALAALSQAIEGLRQVLAGMQAVQGGGGAPVQQTPAPGGGTDGSGCGCCASMQADAGADALQGPPPADTPASPTPPAAPQAPQPSNDAPAGDVRQRIVQIANEEGDRGVTEDAGPDRDKAGRIREYRTAVTGPGEDPDAAEAWCADFTSWVFKQAGAPLGKDGRGEDYVPFLKDWAKQQGRWKTSDPQPGDAIIFNWDGNKSANPDHVGVVVKVEGGRIYTVEGNSSDKVNRNSYVIDAGVIQGFVNPS